MDLLCVYGSFFKMLPEISEKLIPIAKKANLSVNEALFLLACYYADGFALEVSQPLKNVLIAKQLIEYNGKSATLTSKGRIIVKSIINGLER